MLKLVWSLQDRCLNIMPEKHYQLFDLGKEQKVAENADGDEKQVEVKKDYEIFITVK